MAFFAPPKFGGQTGTVSLPAGQHTLEVRFSAPLGGVAYSYVQGTRLAVITPVEGASGVLPLACAGLAYPLREVRIYNDATNELLATVQSWNVGAWEVTLTAV